MSSNQPAKKVRFEAYLTPENYLFLRAYAAAKRRTMSGEVDLIVSAIRIADQLEKEKAPNALSV